MRILTQLKAWQLFIPFVILGVYGMFLPEYSYITSPLYIVLTASWMYSIVMSLIQAYPELQFKTGYFKFSYLVVVAFIVAAGIYRSRFEGAVIPRGEMEGSKFWLGLGLGVFYVWSMFYLVYISAKKLNGARRLREQSSGENTFVYFFAFWFAFIGVWFVQPKVRFLLGHGDKK